VLGILNGPWLVAAASVLLVVALQRGPLPSRRDVGLLTVLTVCAIIARLAFGLWLPLHINGQGPLWIRGALEPDALSGYGPGYFELFTWVARWGAPDRAIFAANAVLSALSPALLSAVARLVGVERRPSYAAAIVLAGDAVTIRTAATELYIWPIVALVLAAWLSVAAFMRARAQDKVAARLALLAACLFAAAAARIHLVALLPLVLSPLIALCGSRPASWREKLIGTVTVTVAIAAAVLVTTGRWIVAASGSSPIAGHIAVVSVDEHKRALIMCIVAVLVLQRWARPRALPAIALASLPLLWIVQLSFNMHPFEPLFYARLCWPGLLLGAAALVPRGHWGWPLAVAIAATFALLRPALPFLNVKTTEQVEYAFLRRVLPVLPADCVLAAVNRADKRVWELPLYLMASGSGYEIQTPDQLAAGLGTAPCIVYVHSSLCSTVEGRPICESAERDVRLEYVASEKFRAAPSYLELPYDRPAVDVVVSRAAGSGSAPPIGDARGGGRKITPVLAQSLFARINGVKETDGCRLTAFDTNGSRITIGLQSQDGARHALDLRAAQPGAGARLVGDWALTVSSGAERACGRTISALERILSATPTPGGVP
jgi:hypothetical protein